MRTSLFSFALGSLTVVGSLWTTVAGAQQANPAPGRQQTQAPTREIQGKVIRTGDDHIVVQTKDNKEVTVYTHPKTTYLSNKQEARFSDVRVGGNITAVYDMDGTRYLANNVVWVPAQAAEGVTVQPATPGVDTVVQGRIIRVVGQDQVIVQTSDGKEVTVYVSPQTTYQLSGQGGAFADLRPGVDVGINYDVRDRRFQARRIFRSNR